MASWRRLGLLMGVISALALSPPAGADIPGVSGVHTAVGATSASQTWLFAEGYTGLQEYLTLGNDEVTAASVTLDFQFNGGGSSTQNVMVAPKSRATVDVNAAVGPYREVSVKVASSIPIVAERPVYFAAPVARAGWVDGGHDIVGASATSTSWSFAEGFTGSGFQTYVTVQNPDPSPTTFHLTFAFTDGTTSEITRPIAGSARATVDVNDEVGPDREVSISGSSTAPTVMERPIYFARSGVGTLPFVQGGHNVVGVTSPSQEWFFAEGQQGGSFEPTQTYITVLNANPTPVHVDITFQNQDGSEVSLARDFPATSRGTIDVADALPSGAFSFILEASQAVVAERLMYVDLACAQECLYNGGSAAVGARGPGVFLFAEGYTGESTTKRFATFVALQNPSGAPVTAMLRFLLADGSVVTHSVDMLPTSRAQVDAAAVVGINQEFSIHVDATAPITAERSTYFRTGPIVLSPTPGPMYDPSQAAMYLYRARVLADRDAGLAVATQAVVDEYMPPQLQPDPVLPVDGRGNRYLGCDPEDTQFRCFFYYEGGGVNMFVADSGSGFRVEDIILIAD